MLSDSWGSAVDTSVLHIACMGESHRLFEKKLQLVTSLFSVHTPVSDAMYDKNEMSLCVTQQYMATVQQMLPIKVVGATSCVVDIKFLGCLVLLEGHVKQCSTATCS